MKLQVHDTIIDLSLNCFTAVFMVEVGFLLILFNTFYFKRVDFDRSPLLKEGFKEHIKMNHYMWNYVFFIAYLKWKDKNDYTGIESYVFDKIEAKDVSWYN